MSDRYFENDTLHQLLGSKDLVIFDYNGLIVDDEPLQLQAFNEVFEKYDLIATEQEFIDGVVELLTSGFVDEVLEDSGIPNTLSAEDFKKNLLQSARKYLVDRSEYGILAQRLKQLGY